MPSGPSTGAVGLGDLGRGVRRLLRGGLLGRARPSSSGPPSPVAFLAGAFLARGLLRRRRLLRAARPSWRPAPSSRSWRWWPSSPRSPRTPWHRPAWPPRSRASSDGPAGAFRCRGSTAASSLARRTSSGVTLPLGPAFSIRSTTAGCASTSAGILRAFEATNTSRKTGIWGAAKPGDVKSRVGHSATLPMRFRHSGRRVSLGLGTNRRRLGARRPVDRFPDRTGRRRESSLPAQRRLREGRSFTRASTTAAMGCSGESREPGMSRGS